MASFQNPRLLNEAKRYSQACAILRSTSRARNKAWFQEALELDYQLHLRSEGGGIVSRLFDRRSGDWSEGPAITSEVLRDGEKAAAFAHQLIELARQARANALGVTLYRRTGGSRGAKEGVGMQVVLTDLYGSLRTDFAAMCGP